MEQTQSRRAARRADGFALVELLIVIAVLAILAGVALFGIASARHTAEVSACRAEGSTIIRAIEAARLENQRLEYPGVAGPDGLDGVRAAGVLEWGEPSKYWRYTTPAASDGLAPDDVQRSGLDRVDAVECPD